MEADKGVTMPVLENPDTIFRTWKKVDQVAHDYLMPIETKTQYKAALKLLESLWEKVGEDAASPYGSLFTLLTERITAYEAKHVPFDSPTPAKVLEYLIEERGVTQQEVADATKIQQSNLNQLIKGKRQPTTEHIKRLAKYFRVEPSVFF
jgi:HTH-type transcriptional regulator / antitoxin HigA